MMLQVVGTCSVLAFQAVTVHLAVEVYVAAAACQKVEPQALGAEACRKVEPQALGAAACQMAEPQASVEKQPLALWLMDGE